MTRRPLMVMGAWLVLAGIAAAEDGPTRQLDPVVVSASALPLTETAVNQHASVYTRDQIERDAPASVAEFLARRAGVVMEHGARSGGFGSLFLRGADPSHVVVLIDGIRQNDPLSSRGSAVDLNTLTLDDVERIEVVRGNASVVHREALAGVVQIFTRPPRQYAQARAGVEAGGQGLRAANASVAQGRWRAGLAQREDGLDSVNGSSRTRAANAGFRDQWASTRVLADMRLTDSRNRGFPDDSGGAAHAVNRTLEERRSESQQLALALNHDLNASQALELTLTHFRRNSFQDTPSVAAGIRDPFGLPRVVADGSYRRNEAQANWRLTGISGWNVLLGAGNQTETGTLDSTVFAPVGFPANFHIHRVTNSVVGEALKSMGSWSLQAGVRLERTPGYGSAWHPALSFQYRLAEDKGRIGGAVSSASKLPSFFALGHPLVGNPALRPERSRQAELYYANSESSLWKTRVTLFQARFRDLVDFDPGPPPRLVNRASIWSTGLEFSLRRDWRPGLVTYAQGTLMNVRDPEGGPPLRFRPRRQASAGIEAQVAPQWRLHSGITYVGRRYDSSIPTGDVWLGGYAETNVSVTWLGSRWQMFAAADNALNRKADETIGTSIGERRLRVGIRWAL